LPTHDRSNTSGRENEYAGLLDASRLLQAVGLGVRFCIVAGEDSEITRTDQVRVIAEALLLEVLPAIVETTSRSYMD